jgi:GNAT superfamily N-acetyltransferase
VVTLDIKPVTRDRFDDLGDLFESNAATKGCWCMVHILERKVWHGGWRNGGNRRLFEEMAKTADPPIGLIGYSDSTPAAWCAIGPRSRYPRCIGPRAVVLAGRDKTEDDDVWLFTCFFTRVGFRSKGVTRALIDAATALAKEHGAKAIEGIPLATGAKRGSEYVGRETAFEACGFACVARPTPQRAVMRKELRRR